MPARKLRKSGIKRPKTYMGLRRRGKSKSQAAKIANAGRKGSRKGGKKGGKKRGRKRGRKKKS